MEEEFIIGVHGVPRSGTSWLGQLVNASPIVNFKFQPLFSYRFKDYINSSSTCEDVNHFLREISKTEDDFINLKDRNLLGEYPDFKKDLHKTHLVFKQVRYHFLIEKFLRCFPQIKFLLIVRNPLEVLNSWRKAPREFKQEWNFKEEWKYAHKKNQNKIEEYFGYAKWKEATQLFHDLKLKYPNQIKIVEYNVLRKNTLDEVNIIYDFLDLKLVKQVEDFINHAKYKNNKHPNSVYKSNKKRSSYKVELPLEIIEYIYEDLVDTNLNYLIDEF